MKPQRPRVEPASPSTDCSTDDHRRLVAQYTEIAQLAGGLAHEIKNPLSTIRLNMELLAEDLQADDSPGGRRALAKIAVMQRECQRLQDLLDDFLNFAKVRQPRLEPCDLNEEVRQVLEFFAPPAAEPLIGVDFFPDPDLPKVLLDREIFRGAIVNLVINAYQAMPHGGQLFVRTRVLGTSVVLDLIDTGAGIDAHTLPQIFDAFFSTKPGGSGLGLPTTRKIVEAHRGRIWVQSEPGRGTQFTLELPVPPRLAASSTSDS